LEERYDVSGLEKKLELEASLVEGNALLDSERLKPPEYVDGMTILRSNFDGFPSIEI
jgi:hypothetical protein